MGITGNEVRINELVNKALDKHTPAAVGQIMEYYEGGSALILQMYLRQYAVDLMQDVIESMRSVV